MVVCNLRISKTFFIVWFVQKIINISYRCGADIGGGDGREVGRGKNSGSGDGKIVRSEWNVGVAMVAMRVSVEKVR